MAVAGEFGHHRLYKMLGYFSLVGLLRLHSLLGDYHQALRVIDNMNVNRKVTHACCTKNYHHFIAMCKATDALEKDFLNHRHEITLA